MNIGARQGEGESRMRRISAIFIAVCMVLIAVSLGAVLYLGVKLDGLTSAIVALAALTGMALYNAVTSRLRDRSDVGDQIADLSRGTADLARQVGEIGRKVMTLEAEVAAVGSKARAAVEPLSSEIVQLGAIMKEIADAVAAHESALVDLSRVEAPAAPYASG